MKKLYFTILFLMTFALSGLAQSTYYPLVHEDEDQQWNVLYVTEPYHYTWGTEIQFIEGDSIIDGIAYKQAWRKNSDGTGLRIKGFVHEVGKRVYSRLLSYYNGEYVLGEEVLLYDFNLTVGDTVVVGEAALTLMVIEESEVEVNGTMRRQLGLGFEPWPFGSVYEYWVEGVGSTYGFLNSGSETICGSSSHLLCYHENDGLIWDNEEYDSCVLNSNETPSTFAPQGAEWYFQVDYSSAPITQPSFGYIRYSVTGIDQKQWHTCSVINGNNYVYEENNVVYWYNQYNDAFTVLYDFNAEVGDTWYCDVNECTCLVTVTNVDSVTYNGHTYRTQYVTAFGDDDYPYFDGRIINGIGYERGLFPDEMACEGGCFDCDEISYIRCYLVNDEMLYHEGDYYCDYIPGVTGNCWDGTVAESYAGGDGTPDNPYLISNGKQLALLAQQTNDGTGGEVYYKLTKEINLQKCTTGLNPWTSIGTPEHPFTGHFDGNEKHILNLYQCQNTVYKGLFGCTNGAEIKDVNLVYCEIGNASEYAGGLVGYAGLTDISNCSVQNSQIITTGGVAGGIVGYAGMPFGIHETNENISIITNCKIDLVTVESTVDAGGIVGKVNGDMFYARYLVSNCSANNEQYYHVKGSVSGGIVGEMRYGTIEGCASKTIVVGTGQVSNVCVGGIAGSIHGSSVIANSYNRGNVVADFEFAGGIAGYSAGNVYNVYNAGEIYMPDPNSSGYGTIVGIVQDGTYLNCYWLENELPATGNYYMPEMPGSTSFHQGATPKSWVLNQEQYGTTDLVEALNLGANDNYLWREDANNTNNGFPVCVYIEPTNLVSGSEWYYEILNDDGSITYQYLQHTSDTTVQDEPVQIIVKINTLYDKGEHVEKSYEYIYERDGKIYWWNKTLEEFTVLYDYNAQEGDEWEIKAGTQSLVMHVDAVEYYEYEGRTYKILQVSDLGNLFSGTIVCGIGHLTSFFPEKLINQSKNYRVEGIRCFWQDGELVFKYGDRDCDEVYEEFHDYGVDEPAITEGFKIYPNPTDGIIVVETLCIASLQNGQTEYRITNLMGQTLMTGQIHEGNQQIVVKTLPKGLFFITIGESTQKLIMK